MNEGGTVNAIWEVWASYQSRADSVRIRADLPVSAANLFARRFLSVSCTDSEIMIVNVAPDQDEATPPARFRVKLIVFSEATPLIPISGL